MYDELVRRLRERATAFDYDGWVETAIDYEKAADAIEELSAKATPNGKYMEAEKYVAISDVYNTLTEKYHHTLGVQHEALKEALAAVPAADVRPVRYGKWEDHGWSIRCSECGYDMPFATRNFCPNCGADMREKS